MEDFQALVQNLLTLLLFDHLNIDCLLTELRDPVCCEEFFDRCARLWVLVQHSFNAVPSLGIFDQLEVNPLRRNQVLKIEE